jgi:hypothetical protein
MAKKVTISVPDELHQKMEKWRKTVNFSKVFQEAVSNLIQKKEDFQKRLKVDSNMAEIIERLKREKKEAEEQWFDQGKNDGLEFAKSADYEMLQYALRWETVKEMPGNIIGADPTKDDTLGDYFTGVFENYDGIGFEETFNNQYMPNRAYCDWETGWKEGVIEFWDEVKNKI